MPASVVLGAGVSGQEGWHLACILLAEGATVWRSSRDRRPTTLDFGALIDLMVDAEWARFPLETAP